MVSENRSKYARRKTRTHVELTRHPQYGVIRKFVGRYVYETIPEPALTAGGAWVPVALPSASRTSSRRRLLTSNCGGLETLYVVEEDDGSGGDRIFVMINTSRTANDHGALRLLGRLNHRIRSINRRYSERDVLSSEEFGLEAANALLDRRPFLDAAYRSNASLMRPQRPPLCAAPQRSQCSMPTKTSPRPTSSLRCYESTQDRGRSAASLRRCAFFSPGLAAISGAG